ncbi:MAG TPA: cytochrome b N-terminal domain-containing protein [bacterium]|nr:cytochrome b N-terminal domain-containing protein [bacterium]
MTAPSRQNRLWTAVDARLALHNFLYEVPAYANTLPYVLGAITLMGLVILVGTGILLGQFYVPDPAAANQSIRAIMAQVPGGEVIRGVHVWAAHLTVAVLVLHILRVFVTGAYRYPREANWAIGVALFATMLALFFTGTVLRWDQEAIEALAHNVEFAALLGVFGGWFSPAFSSHVPLLTRLYMAHVSLLPLLLFMLLVGHVYLVRQHGISPHLTRTEPSGARYTFADHLRKAVGYGCIMLGLALALSVIAPPGEGAAPVAGIEVTKPPWLFLPLYGLENLFGLRGLWGTAVFLLWLLAVPILDRGRASGWAGRRRALAAGAVVLAVIITLGMYAWLRQPVAHLH